MHIHHREDETLYILEGTLLVVYGDRFEAKPGTFVYGPRNIPHGFRAVGDVPVGFVETFLPAGLEQLFLETGKPVTGQARPQTEEVQKPSMDAMMTMMAKYGIEIVGPIPE